MENFSFVLDIRRSKERVKKGDRVIVGYATTYDVKQDNLQITREALDGAKDDLVNEYSTVLFNHNSDRPIGKIVEAEVDDIGLLIKMVLSKEEDEIWAKVKDGTINKFSIQGRVLESRPLKGFEHIIQVTKIKLFEAGLVSVPGDPDAKTISWWVARSLTESLKKMKTIRRTVSLEETPIGRLKSLSNRSEKGAREELESIIKELEERMNIISKLEILAGTLEDGEKETIEIAVGMLKRFEKEEIPGEEKTEELENDENEGYNLADESDDRPLFQLHLSDDSLKQEGTSKKFRKQLLKKGKWYHWGADGGVLNITDEIIDNIIKNFKKKVVENVFVPLTHTNDPSKNTGHVIKLEKTGDGLDAIIEIKEEPVLEKIKKGLIRGISASIDPNYRDKKLNDFMGPTLLHAALVTEPFIKGMSDFITLSEYSDRRVILLEDEKPSFYNLLEMVKKSLNKIEENMTKKEFKKSVEPEEVIEEEVKEEENVEKPEEETEETEEKEEIAEAKGPEEDEEEEKEITEAKKEKEEYIKCLEKETESGKSIADAIKTCRIKLSINSPEEQPEEKSGCESEEQNKGAEEKKVDFSDAETSYEEYLKAGKIVPAQKDAFIQLFASSKVLNLGDTKVDFAKTIRAFMESQPKIMNFEETGTASIDKGEEDINKEAVPSDALDLFKKMGLSDEASQEAWKEANRIAEDEKKSKESTLFE